jgi:hypothetical protein
VRLNAILDNDKNVELLTDSIPTIERDHDLAFCYLRFAGIAYELSYFPTRFL